MNEGVLVAWKLQRSRWRLWLWRNIWLWSVNVNLFLFPLTCCPRARQLISNNSIRSAQWCNSSRLELYLEAPRCECVKQGIADEDARCVPWGLIQVFKGACQVAETIWESKVCPKEDHSMSVLYRRHTTLHLVQLNPEATFQWYGSMIFFFFTCLDSKLAPDLYLPCSKESRAGKNLSLWKAGSIYFTVFASAWTESEACNYHHFSGSLWFSHRGFKWPTMPRPTSQIPTFQNNNINKDHVSWGCWPFHFTVMLMLRDRAVGWCVCVHVCVGKVWDCRKRRKRVRNRKCF